MGKNAKLSVPKVRPNAGFGNSSRAKRSKCGRMGSAGNIFGKETNPGDSASSDDILSPNRPTAPSSSQYPGLWDTWRTTHAKQQGRKDTCRLLVETSRCLTQQVGLEWNAFFHARTNDLYMSSLIRMGVALVVWHNVFFLWLDSSMFFVHLIPTRVGSKLLGDPNLWTIFQLLPSDMSQDEEQTWVERFLLLWLFHATMLFLGIGFPRFHALMNFLFYASFHNHDNMIWSSADSVVRLLSFFLLFFPLDRHTLYSVLFAPRRLAKGSTSDKQLDTWPMWPFRLMQIQMCLIYMSTAISKISGPKWRDGSALYYVVQMDDVFGKIIPGSWVLLDRMGMLTFVTYATLVLEFGAPVLLWLSSTRPFLLGFVLLFHVGIDWTMNLGCFHWIMVVGFSSFLVQPMKRVELEAVLGSISGNNPGPKRV
eukprot:Nitzschia sp. Nitz4//scaffold21_size171442//122206//123574//NITZ4_002180-RA/size171442-snap-gene-0.80-mRNA-1//1//CDS//3329542468//141//frame0